jgi:hypothetical protein
MKKLGIMLSVLLALTGLLLCSCGKGETNDNGSDLPAVETVDEADAIDLSNYLIIRSDSASATEKSAAVALRKAISEKCGYQLDLKTDFNGGANLEIVVGQTKRGGADQLNKAEYVIEHSEKGFLIAGGSDLATQAAVNFFIENLLSPSGALCKADFKYAVDNSPVFGDKTYDETYCYVNQCERDVLNTVDKSCDNVGEQSDDHARNRSDKCCCEHCTKGIHVQRNAECSCDDAENDVHRDCDTAKCQYVSTSVVVLHFLNPSL